jgi:uncharacterized membrane protein YphA (DoxX/SURF4 family)
MSALIRRSMRTGPMRSIILIRLMVGAVFLSEGIQKFLQPELRGAGRFEGIGFPAPEFFGYFVATFEVLCGALVLPGLLTRLAAIPLLITMTVAIVITKIPIIWGEGLGPFNVRDMDQYGFWPMAHATRTDWSMWLGSLFLLIVGGGKWSLDRALSRRPGRESSADRTADRPGETDNTGSPA